MKFRAFRSMVPAIVLAAAFLLGASTALAQSGHGAAALAVHAPGDSGEKSPQESASSKVVATTKIVGMPLFFEANRGQADSRVQFLARSSGYTLLLTPTETVFAGSKTRIGSGSSGFARGSAFLAATRTSSSALRMNLVGANVAPRVSGIDELPGKVNYLIGNNPSEWRTGVPLYSEVRVDEVYPGVNLVFHGDQNQLEYDFVVSPGGDPGQVAFRVSGAKKIEIDSRGDLILKAADSEFRMHKPVVYQPSGTERRTVEGKFILTAKNEVRFRIGAYDRNETLVIDPAIGYATFLGGEGIDQPTSLAVDTSNAASPKLYVAGFTSDITTFPETSNPVIDSSGAVGYGFIAKIDPTKTGAGSLDYLTFVGGHTPYSGNSAQGCESVFDGVVLDFSQGASNVVPLVGGLTQCSDYPKTTTIGTVAGTAAGVAAGVATRLNSAGTNFDASVVVGGNGSQGNAFLSVDPAGNVALAGGTTSTNLPLSAHFYMTFNNGNVGANAGIADCYVVDLRRSDLTATYSTYLNTGGGSATNDVGCGAIKDSSGKINAGGNTFSTTAFNLGPNGTSLANGFQTAFHGTQDTFAMRLDPTLNGTAELLYATYYGGGGITQATNGALDLGNGVVAIGGFTTSNGTTNTPDIPLQHALQGANLAAGTAGGETGFLFVVDTTQTGQASLICSTYFGGSSGNDEVHGVNYDAGDPTLFRIILGGQTSSTAAMNFPLQNSLQTFQGVQDGFVSVLKVPQPGQSFTASLSLSTYIGSGVESATGNERIDGVGVDANHTVYAAGRTASTNFFVPANGPVTGFQPGCTSCGAGGPEGPLTDGVIFSLTTGSDAALQAITVTPASATINVSQTQQFKALGLFNDGTEQDITASVTWASSNTALATVSNASGSQGLATGVAGSASPVTISATSGGINGQAALTVSGGAAVTHFVVSAPATATAGTAFNFTVTAQDASNNTVPGYAGTVHFTSTDGAAMLPANSTLTNGVGTFSATLKTAGSRTITATDTATASITGSSNSITVSGGATSATHFAVSAPATATAGVALNLTVTAQDNTNATVPGYAGTVHFTSTDGTAVLPANSTLTNGVGTFSATLKTSGSQTITATDTLTAQITGTSNTVTVTAAGPTLTSITVTPTPAAVSSTGTLQFTATGKFSDGSTQNITNNVSWSVSNDLFATISNAAGSQGLATAGDFPGGPVAITAAQGSISGSAQLAVGSVVVANPAVNDDKQRTDGGSPALQVILTNTSATQTVHFTPNGATADNPKYSVSSNCATLAPGQTCTAEVSFATAAACENQVAKITMADDDPLGNVIFTVNGYGADTNGLVVSDLTSSNLLVNGSFESPLVPATGFTGFANGSTGITGWKVVGAGGGVAIVGGSFVQNGISFPAQDGSQWLDMTGVGSNGAEGVEQTVATTSGTQYTLSFWVGNTNNPNGIFGTSSTIKVFLGGVNGTLLGTATNSNTTTGVQTWQQFTMTFTATGPTTTIDFISADPASDNSNGLDNVVLTGGSQQASSLTPQQLAQSLVGPGVQISNVKYTGAPLAAGTFTSKTNIIGFTSGTVLSTGSVRNVVGPNCSTAIQGMNNQPGDADLNSLLGPGGVTNDAAVLEFDFVPTSSTITFQYVFASDEYNEFVNQFNDVFGFFVNGTNIALVPGKNVPVSINNVNKVTNPTFFVNNDIQSPSVAPVDTEMDGLTVVLSAQAQVNPNQTNHIKLAIADATDFDVDSDVFIASGSLSSSAVSFAPATLAFGNQAAGTTSGNQGVTLSNTGTTAVNISAIAATPPFNQTNACPAQLAPKGLAGSSCVIQVNFGPTGSGPFTGTVTVTDDSPNAGSTQSIPLSGTGTGVAVTTHFLVSAPATATAGTAFNFTVTAQDASNNTVNSYAGTAHFTSSDGAAVLPANATLTNGLGTFSATLKTNGSQTITATDTETASITGTSGAIMVSATAATLVSIAVTPANPTEPINSSLQFHATGTYSDNSTKDITSAVAWASANTAAATISEGGLAKTGATGDLTTKISASLTGVTGSTVLTVTNSPITISVTPPPGGAFPPVPPGGTLAVGIVLTAIPGFSGPVQFSCSTSSPTITCAPDPATVTITPGGPKQVAIVVNTFCTANIAPLGPNPGGSGGGLALLLLSTALGGLAWACKRNPRWGLSFAVLTLIALGGAACNSLPKGPNGATPPGNYTLTISATANGTTTTTPPITFTVQ